MSVITKRFFVGLFILLMVPLNVSAASLSPKAADLTVLPGHQAEFTFTVKNTSSQASSFFVDLIGVEPVIDSEELILVDLPQGSIDIVSLDIDQFTIDSGEEKNVTVMISPAVDTQPEVFMLGLRLVEQRESTGAIQVNQGIVAPFFLTVDGTIEEKFRILDASLTRIPDQSTYSVAFTAKNEGQRILQPQGTLTVTNMFGRVVAVEEVNQRGSRVLPGQTRVFTQTWNKPALAFGRYKITLETALWPQGEEYIKEFATVIINIPLLIAIGLPIPLLFLITRIKKRFF